MLPSDRAYWISGTVCAALLALPFLSVTVPPITDLPQQIAQMQLLSEALSERGSDRPAANQGLPTGYEVRWLDPNKLGYLPLILTWQVSHPLDAARQAMALLAILWVAAIHGLARALRRHPSMAAAASMLFFNHITYWGFLSFLIGFAVFAAWLVKLRRCPPEATLREGPAWLTLTLLLYSAHVLWLAAGCASLLVAGILERWPWRSTLVRLLWTVPALAAVALWYPTFTASGFDSVTTWGSLTERLHPLWWTNSVLGGLRGPVESALLAALLSWSVLGLWQSRVPGQSQNKMPGDCPDAWLATAGAGFLAAAWTLPSVQQHTIFFASRWFPVAVVLLVLACPSPRLRPALRFAFPWLLVASLSFATTATWIAFESEELDGLVESLAHLPPGQRLLGLDFQRASERIQGFPFYHLYAYGQALRGGQLATPFANQASSLVVYEDIPRPVPWTVGLDWRARKIRRSDIPHFDAVLIHGEPQVHEIFLADERLTPITGHETQLWRLYRVRRVD